MPPSPDPGNPPLVTPTFLLSWLVNFVQFLLFYLLVTTVALYAVKEFAASEAASGFAASSFVVGATVARIFAGYLIDVLGRRRIMLAAIVVVTIACALYIPAGTLPLLIVVRFVHGFGYAFASTALMAIAQSAIPSRRRAEGTGYFALGSTLATAVGPALGLFLVGSFSYDALFLVTLATAAVGLLLGLFLRRPAEQREAEAAAEKAAREAGETPKHPRFSLSDIAHPAVIPIGAFMLFVGLCYAGVITYLNAYAEQRDVVTGAGLFFLAYAATMLVMRFVLGRVQDRHGDNVVIYLGLVCFALALGLLAVATADWQIIIAGALTGLGYGTLMPACQAIAVSAVPADKLGTGISTMFLFMDVGLGLGPIALGVLVSATSYGTMYAVLAGVAVLAAVFYHAVHGRHDVAQRGPAAL
ncbi:MFS transporter [Corynebacterium halotolerans]|uniref:MFS transporter n=1 Tax=Corynebacterium halotolerans YIM 70093 = DSM 44683 TaxID=1121362 RepID=M1PA80_9CORY|nr:MFS transporter [Corynebacterium halotolerans]AGF73571.1 MFS transporter [Corynebacterium halotolerans YIM 70093 = DSM 44683]